MKIKRALRKNAAAAYLARRQEAKTFLTEDAIDEFSTNPDLELFRNCLRLSSNYLEFGSGQSTVYAATRSPATCLSIESDPAWATELRRMRLPGTVIHRVNIGRIAKRGRPLASSRPELFDRYFLAPWKLGFNPDLIYVDGRLRVACFVASAIRAPIGVPILFDDYTNRPKYHVVEELMAPSEQTERQALFVKEKSLNYSLAEALLERYSADLD